MPWYKYWALFFLVQEKRRNEGNEIERVVTAEKTKDKARNEWSARNCQIRDDNKNKKM